MLEPLPLIQLREVFFDLVEYQNFEVELSHCVRVQLLLLLALNVFLSECVQIFLVGILKAPVVRLQP